MPSTFLSRVRKAARRDHDISIIDHRGRNTWGDLRQSAVAVAHSLRAGEADLGQKRVGLLASPGFDFAAALWGIWQAGGAAVPLCPTHPLSELEYVIGDASIHTLLTDRSCLGTARTLARESSLRLLSLPRLEAGEPETGPFLEAGRDALVLYTSGTTSRPKGALSTHASLAAQIDTLIQAWGWEASDHILHVLPLHHTHGLINGLLCPLAIGGVCEMLPGFEPGPVWDGLSGGEVTVFMAVPTIYVKLIEHWRTSAPESRRRMSRGAAGLRLMVSGSAALPRRVFEAWEEITGQRLLERYGMTEIGMALSNPLRGERRPGSVGTPLPGVEVRLVDESGREISGENRPGEIQVRGPSVFREYLGRPEETGRTFVDGWFRTGDQAVLERGYYRILGRISQDILKVGGYKLSALEIEEVLRTHPRVEECAVVGVPDATWGQRVGAVLSLGPGESLSLEELRTWARDHLARYKIPSRMILLEEFPRNAMGKIVKSELIGYFDRPG